MVPSATPEEGNAMPQKGKKLDSELSNQESAGDSRRLLLLPQLFEKHKEENTTGSLYIPMHLSASEQNCYGYSTALQMLDMSLVKRGATLNGDHDRVDHDAATSTMPNPTVHETSNGMTCFENNQSRAFPADHPSGKRWRA
ncbi:hypothetical protein HYFRA_00012082 [Hymenoscyphus fraxineus]|uniref:Uncharacterized protein n=1 Tax=Hymenoscyphus fraxineus TaxID=746836 RepID=A0A9N9PUG3_9HELO|nr:hypothetical protein HYFRA_00012082 [Hymenoscyphus fraxineus]